MPQILCRQENGSRAPSRAGRPGLSPVQLQKGVSRLGNLGLLAAGASAAFSVVGRVIAVQSPQPVPLPSILPFAEISAVLVSLAMFAYTRRPGVDAGEALDRGLVYQVLMGFLMGVMYHAFPWTGVASPRGWTPVAVWIVAFPLMVPGTRGKTTLATIATALMDPAGLLVNVATGASLPSPVFLAQLFLPTAVAVGIALAGARVVHQLTVEAETASEMGSYRLVSLIGKGGMGEVWRAEHRMLARPAAIKIIRPDGAGGREAIERFKREAEATATLRSPHTVQLYDFGLTDDGCFFSVMELLDGFALDDMVERWGPMPPARTVHVLLGVCRSLREAHRLGLVHRDIKPGNIFLCRSGTEVDHVKVLDFGLVKEIANPDASVTQTGFITGTPGFMAPEMALGKKEIDGRTDLYSLGCVGFFLLTGETVFEKKTPIEIIMDHARTPPPRPSEKSGIAIPEGLEDLLMDCLAKDPKERPDSAREVERRLWALYLPDIWTPDRAERWWAEHVSPFLPQATAHVETPPTRVDPA
ncbi:MAG TPA: serine/threonine-protein kinase [Thermoanaerobaculia bacterium]|nr:serine/threonine-protein kinase [Thermoanaerobaculia bacterium]HQR66207.1 serine/threonine-protein kinase [Thermoanaerobaculia bacterium]